MTNPTPTKEQQEVMNLLENVIRVARRNNIYVAGFAFSADSPMLVNFGNCSDCGDLKLFEKLISLRNKELERSGQITQTIVEEVN